MIIPPTAEQLRAMSTAPCRYWINHINPPAAPAPQETMMGNSYATAGLAASQFVSNACASDAPTSSPVAQALTDLQQQIGECRYNVDELIGGIGAVLRKENPETKQDNPRPMMGSDLAETIQQMADSVRAIRIRVTDARERLTL